MANRFLKRFDIPMLAVLVTASLASLAPPAGAQDRLSPSEMIERGRKNIQAKLAELIPTVKDARTTLKAIQEFSDTRRLAQRVVAMDYPLDDFAGILLVDSYDEPYVAAVDSIATRFTILDRTLPDASAALVFRDRLGDLPVVGDTPAGFVVAFVISRCVAAATGLPDSMSAAMKDNVTEVAVRAIGELAHTYVATRAGENRQKSDDFWHESVILRMRCPTHGSTYKVQEERNGLKADGSLYRRYVILCEKGGETRKIDFDLGSMGTLSQTGGRQNLKKTMNDPGSRRPGVDQ